MLSTSLATLGLLRIWTTIFVLFCAVVLSLLVFVETFICPHYVTINAVVISSTCHAMNDGKVDCQILVRETGHANADANAPAHNGQGHGHDKRKRRDHKGGGEGKHAVEDPRWTVHALYDAANDAPRDGATVRVYKKASDGSVGLTKPLMTPKQRKQLRVASPIAGAVSFALMFAFFKMRKNRTFRNLEGVVELSDGVDGALRAVM